jgi:hypothetical protein
MVELVELLQRKDDLWDIYGDPDTDGLLPNTPEAVLSELDYIQTALGKVKDGADDLPSD